MARSPYLNCVLGIVLYLAGTMLISSILLGFNAKNFTPLTAKSPRRLTSNVLVLVLINRENIHTHLLSLTQGWMLELDMVGRLIYVVGRNNRSVESVELPPAIDLMELDVDDHEYPPINKELMAFDYIAQNSLLMNGLEFVVKLDSDSYIHPPGLSKILNAHRKANEPLYLGRPLHHCRCSEDPKAPCKKDMGIQYCAGSGYIVNRIALERMHTNRTTCLNPTSSSIADCKSSDTRLGYCMNQVGIKCKPATYPDAELPLYGVSFAEPEKKASRKKKMDSLFCQDKSVQGGVVDRSYGRVYNFRRREVVNCVVVHPLKRVEEMRYVRFLLSGVVEKLVLQEPQCVLAVGLSSNVSRHRTDVRSTWGKVATALGGLVRVKFLVRSPPISNLAEKYALETEQLEHGDLVWINTRGDDDHTVDVAAQWLDWSYTNTNCQFIMKTSDHIYVRILALLRILAVLFPNVVPENAYLGMHRGEKKSVALISTDGDDAFSFEDYHPYIAGVGHMMTRELAGSVGGVLETYPNELNEDNGISTAVDDLVSAGLNISTFAGIEFDYSRCMPDSVFNVPAVSGEYDILRRYQVDLDEDLCKRLVPTSLPKS